MSAGRRLRQQPDIWLLYILQDVQNRQAQTQNLLPAGAKRSIADFGNGYDHTTWKVTHLGGSDTAAAKALDRDVNMATTNVSKHGNFRFKGTAAMLYQSWCSTDCLIVHSPPVQLEGGLLPSYVLSNEDMLVGQHAHSHSSGSCVLAYSLSCLHVAIHRWKQFTPLAEQLIKRTQCIKGC